MSCFSYCWRSSEGCSVGATVDTVRRSGDHHTTAVGRSPYNKVSRCGGQETTAQQLATAQQEATAQQLAARDFSARAFFDNLEVAQLASGRASVLVSCSGPRAAQDIRSVVPNASGDGDGRTAGEPTANEPRTNCE